MQDLCHQPRGLGLRVQRLRVLQQGLGFGVQGFDPDLGSGALGFFYIGGLQGFKASKEALLGGLK